MLRGRQGGNRYIRRRLSYFFHKIWHCHFGKLSGKSDLKWVPRLSSLINAASVNNRPVSIRLLNSWEGWSVGRGNNCCHAARISAAWVKPSLSRMIPTLSQCNCCKAVRLGVCTMPRVGLCPNEQRISLPLPLPVSFVLSLFLVLSIILLLKTIASRREFEARRLAP